MPSVRGQTDSGVVQFTYKRPGIAVFDQTDFWQPDFGPFSVQLARLNLTSLKAECVITAFLSRVRISGNAPEPILVSSVEVAQSLLLAGLGDGGYPVIFGAECSQLTRLADIGNILAVCSLVLSPMLPALLKGDVVNEAANPSKLREQAFLLGRGVQFVTVATLGHRTGRHVVYTPYVYLLVHYPPKAALSKLVNSLKGVFSRLLREARQEITGRYHKGVLWSPSYFAVSCRGAPLSVVAEYIKSQREAAKGRSRIPPRPEGRGGQRGKR